MNLTDIEILNTSNSTDLMISMNITISDMNIAYCPLPIKCVSCCVYDAFPIDYCPWESDGGTLKAWRAHTFDTCLL